MRKFSVDEKKRIGGELKAFALKKFGSLTGLAKALGKKSIQEMQPYYEGRSLPGFELLRELSVLGMDVAELISPTEAKSPAVAEKSDTNGGEFQVAFRSDEERRAVETAVSALVQLAYSYFEFADEKLRADVRRLFTEAELIRYRRRAERKEEVLTKKTSESILVEQGMRRPKEKIDIERIIADAIKEAGPLPRKRFKPDWDARKSVETAVDNWIRRHDYSVSQRDRQRLIDALVLMSEREYSRILDPEKPGKK
ncbi:MAG: hypothetical protein M1469_01200 [Bacteroidetes bacterium]|nr:hypothetical protein [Bacteroidota bacterium]